SFSLLFAPSKPPILGTSRLLGEELSRRRPRVCGKGEQNAPCVEAAGATESRRERDRESRDVVWIEKRRSEKKARGGCLWMRCQLLGTPFRSEFSPPRSRYELLTHCFTMNGCHLSRKQGMNTLNLGHR